ncbi:MAG: LytTR family DNA-binding domain-containing protein [Chitinophagaceae bacterium]|jgi:DNA-binding LytR/AlgR family response regulator|nr:LytTR family DNA-binding domain-containing protein [Chitinophagaceae bacterium]
MEPTTLKVVAADDDLVFREHLRILLSAMPGVELVAVHDGAWPCLAYLQQHTVDVAVLDVEMPGLTGTELARSLSRPPLFIFVTSHPGYAAEGFEIEAVDYIVKPVQKDRLLRALQNARQRLAATTAAQAVPANNDDFVFIRDKNDYLRLELASIVYAEATGDFVQIHLHNGQKHLVLVNMKHFEAQLPSANFIRISRTHLINTNRITAIRQQKVELDQVSLPIGKSYLDALEESLLRYKTIKRYPDT